LEHRILKMMIGRATLAAWLAFAGCAAEPPVQDPSLYQRLGGREVISAAVDDAIDNLAADTRINRRFGNASIPRLQRNLVDLLCVRTGGPCSYSGANMSAAHEGMYIHADEFDALIEDLIKSFDRFNVPAREKGEVLTILRQMKSAVIEH
jgi:hemoglobin